MWTKIRLLLREQSGLGLHCSSKRLLKQFSRRQKQASFVVIGANRDCNIETYQSEMAVVAY